MSRLAAKRSVALVVSAVILVTAMAVPARAENAMGYRLRSEQEAASLPRNHGALVLDVSRAQQISDPEMTFDIMSVTGVKTGSPAAKAGFRRGDQIIAVN